MEIRRQPSYMQDVQKRAKAVQRMHERPNKDQEPPDVPAEPSRRSTRRGTERTIKTTPSRLRGPLSSRTHRSEARSSGKSEANVGEQPSIQSAQRLAECLCIHVPPISFRTAVVAALITAVVIACAAMFTLLAVFTMRFQDMEIEGCALRVTTRRGLIQELVYDDITSAQFESRVTDLASQLDHWVTLPANRALDAVWGHMLAEHRASPAWTGTEPSDRLEVGYREWVELTRPWGSSVTCSDAMNCGRRLVGVTAAFETGQLSGFSLNCDRTLTLDHVECTSANAWDSAEADTNNGSATITSYLADVVTGKRLSVETGASAWYPESDPSLLLQKKLQETLGNTGLPERAWTEAHKLTQEDSFGFVKTAPIAFCGTYHCLKGYVGASISMKELSYHCSHAWEELRSQLAEAKPGFNLTADGSAIFVVNQVSWADSSQQGLLLGASNIAALSEDELVFAEDSPSEVVRMASRILLARYSTWDNGVLLQENKTSDAEEKIFAISAFNFSKSQAMQSPAAYEPCVNYKSSAFLDQDLADHDDCFRVAAATFRIDDRSRWLVVMVLPADAFASESQANRLEVDSDYDTLEDDLIMRESEALITGLGVLIVSIVLAISFGSLLGVRVSRPLAQLGKMLELLKCLDFDSVNPVLDALQKSRRSRIRDVRGLQDAFSKLCRGTEAFARFVPETVVRNIIHDRHKAELELERRRVTIMNSDIEGFTAISEKLRLDDLLLILWRYLSVMTHIVEVCEGVVSEIQGDGLVVFWNTPDTVEDHASKACAAALAQQHAVGLLYREFTEIIANWTEHKLNVRIGIHTGEVLSGHIGSSTKMKFGCLGEPLKIAADLQENCKVFGAKVMISGNTYGELNSDYGLLCRRLAGDQKEGPNCIYEVIGRESPARLVTMDSRVEAIDSTSTENSNMRKLPTSHLVQEGLLRSSGSITSEWGTKTDFCPQESIDGQTARQWYAASNRGTGSSMAEHSEPGGPLGTMGSLNSQTGLGVGGPSVTVENSSPILEECMSTGWQGEVDRIPPDMIRRSQVFEQALDALYTCRFDEAQTLAQSLAEEIQDDEAAVVLVERIQEQRVSMSEGCWFKSEGNWRSEGAFCLSPMLPRSEDWASVVANERATSSGMCTEPPTPGFGNSSGTGAGVGGFLEVLSVPEPFRPGRVCASASAAAAAAAAAAGGPSGSSSWTWAGRTPGASPTLKAPPTRHPIDVLSSSAQTNKIYL